MIFNSLAVTEQIHKSLLLELKKFSRYYEVIVDHNYGIVSFTYEIQSHNYEICSHYSEKKFLQGAELWSGPKHNFKQFNLFTHTCITYSFTYSLFYHLFCKYNIST